MENNPLIVLGEYEADAVRKSWKRVMVWFGLDKDGS